MEISKWRVDLDGRLYRLAGDMSRPVVPHAEEKLYPGSSFRVHVVAASLALGQVHRTFHGKDQPARPA